MKGTEKQIAYATDIINKTIVRIDAVISKDIAKMENHEARVQASMPNYIAKKDREIISAWEEYRANMESILDLADYPASEIIRFEKECGWFNYGNDFVCDKCGHSAF